MTSFLRLFYYTHMDELNNQFSSGSYNAAASEHDPTDPANRFLEPVDDSTNLSSPYLPYQQDRQALKLLKREVQLERMRRWQSSGRKVILRRFKGKKAWMNGSMASMIKFDSKSLTACLILDISQIAEPSSQDRIVLHDVYKSHYELFHDHPVD